ncbi:hypothetical protein [Flagellimonas zhangzhouensis]|uniref:Uncharacterized protein n=1 Tax=Flagellimonas zhangzhouensis TaxID=1073328 RepID=A0A1H2Y7P1_9FLAO|nr:hypothetical protein [Allomuricauda zhangzhouensis]SDQ98544.1 hypothetical protein SAMN05216294_3063 [Allomuricauda zhangzhouensis]SDX01223.1 hypothetical protein SAMN04487892_2958 [Allomuricauda zhangzhouensis]
MSDGFMLLNHNLFWPLLIGCLVLLGFFVWKEWHQKGQSRFWIKIAVACIGLTSLFLLILKPATPKDTTTGKAIVLTEGYRAEQLDSLKKVFKRIKSEEYVSGKSLSIIEDVDSLFLLGHGVPLYDFWQLEGKSVQFLGGEAISGWTQIHHTDELELGEELKVQAQYQNPQKEYWAVLKDNGGNPLDSVQFEEGEEQLVQFTVQPKASGHFVYQLEEKNAEGALVSSEPIPFIVEDREPLHILILNTFPTFESKYLKNYLAEKGHQVLVRSQLTKNKYKFEYFNRDTQPIYQLSKQALEAFDLLVFDVESYQNLGRSASTVLKESMAENGLGVFIQPSGNLFTLSKNQLPIGFDADFNTDISLGNPPQSLQKYPFAFQQEFPLQPIKMDSTTIAAYLPQGKGKMGTSLLQNTYQLVLDGKPDSYAAIWTEILDALVPQFEKSASWEMVTDIPRVDEPANFWVHSSTNPLEVEIEASSKLPLLQDVPIPSRWKGVQYPRKKGWNQLQIPADSTSQFSYFVFGKNERTTVSQQNVYEQNQRYFGQGKSSNAQVSATSKKMEPISPLWFFVPFLLSMGWLWLEPKL